MEALIYWTERCGHNGCIGIFFMVDIFNVFVLYKYANYNTDDLVILGEKKCRKLPNKGFVNI